MIGIDLLKKVVKKIIYLCKRKTVYLTELNSYSQAGEDAVLNFLFMDKKMGKISYLDIGTNIPDECNNTYLFYRRGSRGVCVEADISFIPLIKKVRPDDIVINAGVADSELKEAPFFLFNINGLNTFDKVEAQKRTLSGSCFIIETVMVQLIRINELISNNFTLYPDLLSIDIEGLDLLVLKSLNFDKYPIPVICVETCSYSECHIRPKDHSISDFMISKGYEIYADTYVNTIFVHKEWFYSIV